MSAKQKGCRGEREFAQLCKEHGYEEARRGQQFCGGIDSPDVSGLPGIHIECKRVEKLNIHEAMAQSIRDAAGQAIPIVAHRRNRDGWRITMRAADWFKLYKAWERMKQDWTDEYGCKHQ